MKDKIIEILKKHETPTANLEFDFIHRWNYINLADEIIKAIEVMRCCTELPTEKEKESKKLEILKWIQTDVNTEVNRTDWRSGFEYCYRWINGDLRK